jgi:hypothetical protein
MSADPENAATSESAHGRALGGGQGPQGCTAGGAFVGGILEDDVSLEVLVLRQIVRAFHAQQPQLAVALAEERLSHLQDRALSTASVSTSAVLQSGSDDLSVASQARSSL